MSLDPTARESNFKDSIKRYLVETVKRTDGLHLTFDIAMGTPIISGKTLDRWIAVRFASFFPGVMSSYTVEFYPSSRQDTEGFKLSQVRDTLIGRLTSNDAEDGQIRIPFYRSYKDQPWELIGGILVQDIFEGPTVRAADDTNYKTISVIFRFASKL
jgi:hypothetical protein